MRSNHSIPTVKFEAKLAFVMKFCWFRSSRYSTPTVVLSRVLASVNHIVQHI